MKKVEKLGFKLLIVLCFNVFIIEPNFLAQYVAPRLHTFVIYMFFKFLSLEWVLPTCLTSGFSVFRLDHQQSGI